MCLLKFLFILFGIGFVKLLEIDNFLKLNFFGINSKLKLLFVVFGLGFIVFGFLLIFGNVFLLNFIVIGVFFVVIVCVESGVKFVLIMVLLINKFVIIFFFICIFFLIFWIFSVF